MIVVGDLKLHFPFVIMILNSHTILMMNCRLIFFFSHASTNQKQPWWASESGKIQGGNKTEVFGFQAHRAFYDLRSFLETTEPLDHSETSQRVLVKKQNEEWVSLFPHPLS